MPASFENEAERDAFLAQPRLAILMTNRPDQAPMGVPVWFEWTGNHVQMFSARGVPKLKRLQEDPRAMFRPAANPGQRLFIQRKTEPPWRNPIRVFKSDFASARRGRGRPRRRL